jgi:hypothetical protein
VTASEKLKALEPDMWSKDTQKYWDVRSQIVAVVEAAERLKDAERAKDVPRLVIAGMAVGNALAALDEALS